jgi:hypothetical protein
MIHGRFGELTRPYVSAQVTIAKAERIAKINFLIDTGADTTCLMPSDVFALRLRQPNWGDPVASRGIGGEVAVYENFAALMFLELGVGLVVHDIPVYVYPNEEPYNEYPSILGRDILDSWRIRYSFIERELTADVLATDIFRIPLPIGPGRPG